MVSRGCLNSSKSFLFVVKNNKEILLILLKTVFVFCVFWCEYRGPGQKVLKYKELWTVCGDLKVISMILGQQGGYTKFPCFLCEWDSRAKSKHWNQKVWPKRTLKVGEKNVHFESLVDP